MNDDVNQQAATAPVVQPTAQNTTVPDLPDMTSSPASDINTQSSDPVSAPVAQDLNAPISTDDSAVPPVADEPASDPVMFSQAAPADDSLLNIKKEALQNLAPLLDHLDQSPEEKFNTTMMLIQASDNKDLIQAAYTSANAITDEKVRAQALLDIVNEINYFTQKSEDKA